MARAGLLVLACAFSSAGQAQLQARNLDHAVGELVRTLVNEGRLSGQKVYVGADDFFEEENELRPPLSKILRTMCLRALTDRQVEVALVPAEACRCCMDGGGGSRRPICISRCSLPSRPGIGRSR